MARNMHTGVCSPFYTMRNECLLPILKNPRLALVMHTRNSAPERLRQEAWSSGLHSKALSLCPPPPIIHIAAGLFGHLAVLLHGMAKTRTQTGREVVISPSPPPSMVTLNPAKDSPAPCKLPTSVEAISGLGTLLRPSLEKHSLP